MNDNFGTSKTCFMVELICICFTCKVIYGTIMSEIFFSWLLSFSGAHICPIYASVSLLNFIIIPENLGVQIANIFVVSTCFFLIFSLMLVAFTGDIPIDDPLTVPIILIDNPEFILFTINLSLSKALRYRLQCWNSTVSFTNLVFHRKLVRLDGSNFSRKFTVIGLDSFYVTCLLADRIRIFFIWSL